MQRQFAEKIYVGMLSITKPDGSIIPLRILWEDGNAWDIDRVLQVRAGVAKRAGGDGICFLCRISGNEREIWYSHGVWFVEGHSV